MVEFLSEVIVVAIHKDQINLYGGTYGVRDAAALDAAINMPKAQFGGEFLHPTVLHMAAAYGFHICQNHPFFDGNKRAAGMTMLTFLELNGIEPTATKYDYYYVMMAVANGQVSKEQLVHWLRTTGVKHYQIDEDK